jgi:hypothetical protein
MINHSTFTQVRERFEHFASWAVWAEQGERSKDNIGDLSPRSEILLHRRLYYGKAEKLVSALLKGSQVEFGHGKDR